MGEHALARIDLEAVGIIYPGNQGLLVLLEFGDLNNSRYKQTHITLKNQYILATLTSEFA